MTRRPSFDGSLGTPAEGFLGLSTWTAAELAAAGVADVSAADRTAGPTRSGAYARADAATRTRMVADAHRTLADRDLLTGTGPQVRELDLLRRATAPKLPLVSVRLSGDHDTGDPDDGGTYTAVGSGVTGPDGALWVLVRWADPFTDEVAVSLRTPERWTADLLSWLRDHGSPAVGPLRIASAVLGTMRFGAWRPRLEVWNLLLLPGRPLNVANLGDKSGGSRDLDPAAAQELLVGLIAAALR